MSFTHLHVHTQFSLLDGSSKITEIVRRAKELNMDSLAITDHGVMYGVIDFYRAAKEVGIKPILGCEVYVAPGSRFDKEPVTSGSDDRYYHLVLLAENNTGYHNLMKIVSKGFVDGFYYKPRVDLEVLKEYSVKQIKRKKTATRPSVLQKLKKFKEIVAKTPRKEKEKKKEHER